MNEDMTNVWQSLLARAYKGEEAEVLASLAALLFSKGIISREELDSLQKTSETEPTTTD